MYYVSEWVILAERIQYYIQIVFEFILSEPYSRCNDNDPLPGFGTFIEQTRILTGHFL